MSSSPATGRVASTVAGAPEIPNYGIDSDRLLKADSPLAALRRRLDGRYAVDEFGGDPHLQDLVLRPLLAPIRVDVRGAARIPSSGPALFIANRGPTLVEPFVLLAAVHEVARRRLRVVGAPSAPLVGTLVHKLGGVGRRAGDVAAVLRAGHLAAAPLAPSWWGVGAGEAPRSLIAATIGFPLIPVAIRSGGPARLPVRPWVVNVGEPLDPPPGTGAGDPLAAAELAEQVRAAIDGMLRANPPQVDDPAVPLRAVGDR